MYNNLNDKPKQPVKPSFTPEILEMYFEVMGIKASYDLIRKRPMYTGVGNENPEFIDANIVSLIYSDLQDCYKKVTFETVTAYLNVILSRNCFNPILIMTDLTAWDGTDRVSQVYDILGIAESDHLSQTLVHKWLWQTAALQYNTFESPFGADGVLCLTGKQGIGKTSFFRTLAYRSEYFKEGAVIDFRDKDTYIRALTGWICELGEAESSLRRDNEKMKAFITQSVDEYRKPYGRGDIRSLRRTSFCATCNSSDYLTDTTGNRRFWTVPVEHIDLKALAKLDVEQLWVQIMREIRSDHQCFRLTYEEQNALAKRNFSHEKPVPAQAEIADILSDSGGDRYSVKYRMMTVSEFREMYDCLRPYSVVIIGKALSKFGIEAEMTVTGGKKTRCRLLPERIYDKYDYNTGVRQEQ